MTHFLFVYRPLFSSHIWLFHNSALPTVTQEFILVQTILLKSCFYVTLVKSVLNNVLKAELWNGLKTWSTEINLNAWLAGRPPVIVAGYNSWLYVFPSHRKFCPSNISSKSVIEVPCQGEVLTHGSNLKIVFASERWWDSDDDFVFYCSILSSLPSMFTVILLILSSYHHPYLHLQISDFWLLFMSLLSCFLPSQVSLSLVIISGNTVAI